MPANNFNPLAHDASRCRNSMDPDIGKNPKPPEYNQVASVLMDKPTYSCNNEEQNGIRRTIIHRQPTMIGGHEASDRQAPAKENYHHHRTATVTCISYHTNTPCHTDKSIQYIYTHTLGRPTSTPLLRVTCPSRVLW